MKKCYTIIIQLLYNYLTNILQYKISNRDERVAPITVHIRVFVSEQAQTLNCVVYIRMGATRPF